MTLVCSVEPLSNRVRAGSCLLTPPRGAVMLVNFDWWCSFLDPVDLTREIASRWQLRQLRAKVEGRFCGSQSHNGGLTRIGAEASGVLRGHTAGWARGLDGWDAATAALLADVSGDLTKMSSKTTLMTFGLVFGMAATAWAQDAAPDGDAASAAEPAPAAEPGPAPAAAVSTSAAAPGKIFVGLRLGYGLPMGDAAKDSKLSDTFKGMIPIWLDLGYMVTQNVMVGLYGQYAFASVADKVCTSGADCSGSSMRFGVQGQYHILPAEKINPWVGLGIGYEMSSIKASGGGGEATIGMKGMEYVNIQGGADFKLNPAVGIGPFLSFSLGKYGSSKITATGMPDQSQDIPSDQTAMHEWLTLGVRGAFNL